MKKLRLIKPNILVWEITALVILIIFILHPRLHYLLMLLYCICCLLLDIWQWKRQGREPEDFSEKNEQADIDYDGWHFTESDKKLYKAVGHLIIMLFVGIIIGKMGIGWWWHAPHEYKADIQKIKETDDRYDFFPDELPRGAKKVHWICRPGMMQGTSAKMLSFYADSEYVQMICDQYEKSSMIYTYVKEDWMDRGYFTTEDGKEIRYGYLLNSLSEEQLEQSVIYGTYLVEGNHGRCGGILVDPVDNFVYYFFD